MAKESLFKLSKKGRWIYYIFGSVFLAIACIFVYTFWLMEHPFVLYHTGKVFGKSTSQIQAVKVLDITEEPFTTISDGDVYIIQHDGGYAVLVADKSDKVVKELASGKTKDVILAVERERVDSKLQQTLEEQFSSQSFYSQLDLKVGVYHPKPTDSLIIELAIFGIFAGFGLFFFGAAFKVKSDTKKAVQAIEARFPEVRGNLEQLEDIADYVDRDLGVLLYQGVFICTSGVVTMVDLKDVDWLYHIVTSYRTYGFETGRSYALSFNSLQWKRGKKVVVNSPGKKMGDEHIQVLLHEIGQQFPNILLGNDQRDAFKARKRGEQ